MTFAPRPGSVASYVLAALNLPDAPERIFQYEIQKVLGKGAANIWTCLLPTVNHGLLVRGRDEGRRTFYALPSRAAAKPGADPGAAPVRADQAPAQSDRPNPMPETDHGGAAQFSAGLWTDGTVTMMNAETPAGTRVTVELTADQVQQVRSLLTGMAAL